MQPIFEQLAAYNQWANQTLAGKLRTLPEEKLRQPLASSFPSMHQTVLHMWVASSAWYRRLWPQDGVEQPGLDYGGAFDQVVDNMLRLDARWLERIREAAPGWLEQSIRYQNSRQQTFAEPVWQILWHLFNHNTYHRGQLTTLLHQAGEGQGIPGTDFILFCRLPGNTPVQ
ncbi:MAG TPA: DinB family protein [Chitinophagaceae bacterium]|nr:DinB family protein [Chitinophagaceae bacterium]